MLLAVAVVLCASLLESANALRASSVALLMVLAVALVALRGGGGLLPQPPCSTLSSSIIS